MLAVLVVSLTELSEHATEVWPTVQQSGRSLASRPCFTAGHTLLTLLMLRLLSTRRSFAYKSVAVNRLLLHLSVYGSVFSIHWSRDHDRTIYTRSNNNNNNNNKFTFCCSSIALIYLIFLYYFLLLNIYIRCYFHNNLYGTKLPFMCYSHTNSVVL